MKLTNTVLKDAAKALRALTAIRLPVRTSYRVARLAQAVDRALAPYNATKDGLIKEYGTPVEGEPGRFILSEEGRAEHEELLALEAEVDDKPLTLAELGEIEIEPEILIDLGPLLVDAA